MIPNYDIEKIRHPFKARLAQEHINLHEFCKLNPKISYAVTQKVGRIPSEYNLTFRMKSIVGIDENELPIWGTKHVIKVKLPAKYPMEAPVIYAQTKIWHPNIKFKGGRVCGNTKGFGKLFDLSMLAQRLQEILSYKNYHADNTIPFPEDETVARWVRDFAEPYNIINKKEGIAANPNLPEGLKIADVVENEEPEEEIKPKRKRMVIKRKEKTPPKPPERTRFKFRR